MILRMEEKAVRKITKRNVEEREMAMCGKGKKRNKQNSEKGEGSQARCVLADTGTVTV